jgi:hypothetical protein
MKMTLLLSDDFCNASLVFVNYNRPVKHVGLVIADAVFPEHRGIDYSTNESMFKTR